MLAGRVQQLAHATNGELAACIPRIEQVPVHPPTMPSPTNLWHPASRRSVHTAWLPHTTCFAASSLAVPAHTAPTSLVGQSRQAHTSSQKPLAFLGTSVVLDSVVVKKVNFRKDKGFAGMTVQLEPEAWKAVRPLVLATKGTKSSSGSPQRGFLHKYTLKNRIVFVKGNGMTRIGEGSTLRIQGVWRTNEAYGLEVDIISFEELPITSEEAMAERLQYLLDGVGPATAKQLVEKLGIEAEKVLASAQAVQVLLGAGFSRKKASTLKGAYDATQGDQQAEQWLSDLGLPGYVCEAAMTRYGADDARARIKDDPYAMLMDLPGFDFKLADRVAFALGRPPDHPSRGPAAMYHAMFNQIMNSGHTFITWARLRDATRNLLTTCDAEWRKWDSLRKAGEAVPQQHPQQEEDAEELFSDKYTTQGNSQLPGYNGTSNPQHGGANQARVDVTSTRARAPSPPHGKPGSSGAGTGAAGRPMRATTPPAELGKMSMQLADGWAMKLMDMKRLVLEVVEDPTAPPQRLDAAQRHAALDARSSPTASPEPTGSTRTTNPSLSPASTQPSANTVISATPTSPGASTALPSAQGGMSRAFSSKSSGPVLSPLDLPTLRAEAEKQAPAVPASQQPQQGQAEQGQLQQPAQQASKRAVYRAAASALMEPVAVATNWQNARDDEFRIVAWASEQELQQLATQRAGKYTAPITQPGLEQRLAQLNVQGTTQSVQGTTQNVPGTTQSVPGKPQSVHPASGPSSAVVQQPLMRWPNHALVYLDPLHAAEGVVSQTLARLLKRTPAYLKRNLQSQESGEAGPEGAGGVRSSQAREFKVWHAQQGLRSEGNVELTPKQTEALHMAASAPVMLLTGAAGCGKTFSTKAIISVLKQQEKAVMLCAPTGRAAQRLQEAGAEFDLQAKTIHRLLGYKPILQSKPTASAEAAAADTADNAKAATTDTAAAGAGAGADPASGAAAGPVSARSVEVDFMREDMFEFNSANPLPAHAVLIDEASMLDIQVAAALMRALRSDTQLILIGDPNQLPPVGAGSVLHDMIESRLFPQVHLDTIFRQSQGSKIVAGAHKVIHGRSPVASSSSSSDGMPQMSLEEVLSRMRSGTAGAPGGAHVALPDGSCRLSPVKPLVTKVEDVQDKHQLASAKAISEMRDALGGDGVVVMEEGSDTHAARVVSELVQALSRAGVDVTSDVQVLSATKQASNQAGTTSLNRMLQPIMNPWIASKLIPAPTGGLPMRQGDRVVQIENNYETEVFNGDLGTVQQVTKEDERTRTIRVAFAPRPGGEDKGAHIVSYCGKEQFQLQLAWATTVHKAQGAEYPVVIMVMHDSAAKSLQQRKLLYTAVTRGRRLLFLVTTSRALANSTHDGQDRPRNTLLAARTEHALFADSEQPPVQEQTSNQEQGQAPRQLPYPPIVFPPAPMPLAPRRGTRPTRPTNLETTASHKAPGMQPRNNDQQEVLDMVGQQQVDRFPHEVVSLDGPDGMQGPGSGAVWSGEPMSSNDLGSTQQGYGSSSNGSQQMAIGVQHSYSNRRGSVHPGYSQAGEPQNGNSWQPTHQIAMAQTSSSSNGTPQGHGNASAQYFGPADGYDGGTQQSYSRQQSGISQEASRPAQPSYINGTWQGAANPGSQQFGSQQVTRNGSAQSGSGMQSGTQQPGATRTDRTDVQQPGVGTRSPAPSVPLPRRRPRVHLARQQTVSPSRGIESASPPLQNVTVPFGVLPSAKSPSPAGPTFPNAAAASAAALSTTRQPAPTPSRTPTSQPMSSAPRTSMSQPTSTQQPTLTSPRQAPVSNSPPAPTPSRMSTPSPPRLATWPPTVAPRKPPHTSQQPTPGPSRPTPQPSAGTASTGAGSSPVINPRRAAAVSGTPTGYGVQQAGGPGQAEPHGQQAATGGPASKPRVVETSGQAAVEGSPVVDQRPEPKAEGKRPIPVPIPMLSRRAVTLRTRLQAVKPLPQKLASSVSSSDAVAMQQMPAQNPLPTAPGSAKPADRRPLTAMAGQPAEDRPAGTGAAASARPMAVQSTSPAPSGLHGTAQPAQGPSRATPESQGLMTQPDAMPSSQPPQHQPIQPAYSLAGAGKESVPAPEPTPRQVHEQGASHATPQSLNLALPPQPQVPTGAVLLGTDAPAGIPSGSEPITQGAALALSDAHVQPDNQPAATAPLAGPSAMPSQSDEPSYSPSPLDITVGIRSHSSGALLGRVRAQEGPAHSAAPQRSMSTAAAGKQRQQQRNGPAKEQSKEQHQKQQQQQQPARQPGASSPSRVSEAKQQQQEVQQAGLSLPLTAPRSGQKGSAGLNASQLRARRR